MVLRLDDVVLWLWPVPRHIARFHPDHLMAPNEASECAHSKNRFPPRMYEHLEAPWHPHGLRGVLSLHLHICRASRKGIVLDGIRVLSRGS